MDWLVQDVLGVTPKVSGYSQSASAQEDHNYHLTLSPRFGSLTYPMDPRRVA